MLQMLIPRSKVPVEAALIALSLITSAENTQFKGQPAEKLLEWVVSMLHCNCLESTNSLHTSYTVVFEFINNRILRSDACRLLYMLTRKSDVSNFRTEKLKHLTKFEVDNNITALLSLYRLYRDKEFKVHENLSTKGFKISPVQKVFIGRVERVKRKYNPLFHDQFSLENVNSLEPLAKRRKVDIIPVGFGQDDSVLVPYSLIQSTGRAISNMHRIEMPCNIVTLLQLRHLHLLLAASTDPIFITRLHSSVRHILCDEFLEPDVRKSKKEKQSFLEDLLRYCDCIQEGFPAAEVFLQQYLLNWNGEDYWQQILGLVSFLPLRGSTFHEFHEQYLKRLEPIFWAGDIIQKVDILSCLSKLMERWMDVGYFPSEQSPEDSQFALVACEMPDDADFDSSSLMLDFSSYFQRLSMIVLLVEKMHPSLENAILHYLEMTSYLHLHSNENSHPFVLSPSRPLIMLLLSSINISTINRTCQILTDFRDEYIQMKHLTNCAPFAEAARRKTLDVDIPIYNMLITDVLHLLWFGSATVVTFTTAFSELGDNIPNSTDTLSFHRHPALQATVRRFLRETRMSREDIDMTNESNKNTKACARFMKFIKDEGWTGITSFLKQYIKDFSL